MTKEIFKIFLSAIGAFNPSVTHEIAVYPFPYPEKTITFDWDNIGTDLYKALSKIKNEEGQNERS